MRNELALQPHARRAVPAVREVAEIIATLAASGVTVRVSHGRLVVRGASALNFTAAIATLEGREDAVEKALALGRCARRHGEGRSTRSPARGIPSATGGRGYPRPVPGATS